LTLPPPRARKTRVYLALIAAFAAFPAVALATDTTLDDTANGGNPYNADLYGNSGSTTQPSDATAASNNTLILGDGSTGPSFTGIRRIYGGFAAGSPGNANDNTLTVNGGTSFDNYHSYLYGGYADAASGGSASKNVVTVGSGVIQTGGNTGFHIWGGYSSGSDAGGPNAGDGNTVDITGGSATIAEIYGG
jgi:hypothetical protein